MRKAGKFLLAILVVIGAFGLWVVSQLRPTEVGTPIYVRYKQSITLQQALKDLESRSIVKNAAVSGFVSRINGRARDVAAGTYQVAPGMSLSTVVKALRHPIVKLVRLPEGYWEKRTSLALEKADACTADEYLKATESSTPYSEIVKFPLPKSSLEGYLFPDTYDLPPLTEPQEIVAKQLQTFEKKVWIPAGKPKDLERILTVASLVELEAKKDVDRPMIAGVIENRLRLGMPLQIDATVLYARQKWGKLTHAELASIESPYNTYLHKGLPPGPICSPTLKSVLAAMKPAKHDFLYYVAVPGAGHMFSRTLDEQNHNINLGRKAIRKQK